MALYRFRITFEDYDDVVREIDVKSNQTFEDLHRAIHQSTGYNSEYPSSFYISNDQWIKGEEITYLPNQKRIDRGVALMDKVKLLSYIDDPHQKFYYTFNFDRPFDFHVELMKIILDEAPGVTYPAVVKSTGEAPKQFGNVLNVPVAAPEVDDFDFLNEMAIGEDDTDDFSEVTETGEEDDVIAKVDDEEEEDEFGSEFSDDEGFEDDSKMSHGDDY
ncbi:plasmid pRiA4b ORF-3 family protein [Mucilaginibacter sp. BJC16-A38]|uniref:plasmid pRiA4b ORF-3 family protein n=1 Tax=Mucilaginibacter phenanthrenivorans TaxID=1234842 RepID=UPI00215869C6|nr:plasmid pRiA4b ORF-3 family protein [Mucilaginibacter phenanthrenivorans]MCR8559746.1 plasmid pRiA4b ORF-3 family protein [Mucilaginibacter phenanthrenivorans]